ncbi:aryl-sulfate sulfotransferase [bacterium BMS3Abin03]|nr:aryl-sulfate sulfotransferase [bacterium BMS3Abin03]MCG6958911.1 aryl-sulfate sulfotransferase [bacterium BMS3Abin03]
MMSYYTNFLSLKSFIILVLLLATFSISEAQNLNTNKFQYLSPVPNSTLNNTATNIIIRYGEAIVADGISEKLTVTGTKSGKHTGKIILAKNNSTILFKPDIEFAAGEVVTVDLKGNLRTITNEPVPDLKYSYETSKVNLNKIIRSNPTKYQNLLNPDPGIGFKQTDNFAQSIFNQRTYTVQQDSLPSNFPSISIDLIDNPSDGKIFLAPYLASSPLRPNYLIITDNYGVPVFYRKMLTERTLNFVRQSSGVLTYFNTGKYYVMDSSYSVIDSLYMRNGYLADVHECVLIDSGYSLLLSYDYQQVNMDTVISGGDSTATVAGTVIQELDENKNVIFQWRSWDHFKITDATYDIDLSSSTIDYVHANALEMDNDGNILLSSRNLDEITKIDIETGEIIWRMGGKFCENNQFTFENDSIGFSHQHDIRRLPDGRISLFDNGNLHSPQFSRAVEYEIDETNLTATLVWEFKNNPQTFSVAMGNSEILKNDNRVIGWGWTFTPPIVNEVTPDGRIAFSMSIPEGWVNYRGVKYPWKTNLFVTNPDTLFFEYTSLNDSLVKSLKIINNSTSEIQINRILNRDPSFYVATPLPITLPVSGSATIQLVFRTNDQNEHTDDLYLQCNKENERIAQVVPMQGVVITSTEKNKSLVLKYSLNQNYPNPFNPVTKINFTIPKTGKVKLSVYDILGHKIKTLLNKRMLQGAHSIKFNAKNLPSGVYIYTLNTNDYTVSKKMILLK